MNIVVIHAWQLVLKAGPMIWPIILLSIAGLAISIDRFLFLNKTEREFVEKRMKLVGMLRQGNLKETLSLCEKEGGIVGTVMKQGILHCRASGELIKLSMEESWQFQRVMLERFMPMLGMIINLAPLLGLLGTINAMTVVFHASVVRANVLNPASAGDLAAGIWQALLTTSAGLAVGIFCYAAYTVCHHRMVSFDVLMRHLMSETTAVLVSLNESGHHDMEGKIESV